MLYLICSLPNKEKITVGFIQTMGAHQMLHFHKVVAIDEPCPWKIDISDLHVIPEMFEQMMKVFDTEGVVLEMFDYQQVFEPLELEKASKGEHAKLLDIRHARTVRMTDIIEVSADWRWVPSIFEIKNHMRVERIQLICKNMEIIEHDREQG